MHKGIAYVTSGSLDGEDTALDVEEGNIESTTTKVVDQDVALLVGLAGTETVGNGGSGRLVDDTEDVQARDGTGVLGGLPLVVVEVGRDGDDGLLNLLAELDLSNLLHLFTLSAAAPERSTTDMTDLAQNHGGDLLSGESLGLAQVLHLHLGVVGALLNDLEWPGLDVLLDGGVVVSPADQTLDIEDGVGRVHGSLVLGRLTDETLLRGEGNEGWGSERALVVGDCRKLGQICF